MKPQFIQTPNFDIADVGKVGSSSIYRAVLRTFHSDRIPVSVGYDMSNQPNDGGRQRVDRTSEPTNTVLLFVREPVERFRSACAQSRIKDIDELLTHLENGTGEAGLQKISLIESYHFRPHSDYRATGRPTKAFRFPDHIAEFVSVSGLDDLPVVNDAANNPPKPALTPEQQARVEAIYAADTALFDSIAEAGQYLEVVEMLPEPVIPLTEAERQAQAIQTARDAAASAFDSMPAGKRALWESVRVAVEKAIRTGDFAEAKDIIETVPNLYPGMAADRDKFLTLFPND